MSTDPFNVSAPVQTHTTTLRPYLYSTIFNASENCQVTPAYYQRPTEWGEEEVAVLCENMFQWEGNEGEYWLASAVNRHSSINTPSWNAFHFIHDLSLKGMEENGVRKLAIIDGQQRTLTLRLIMLVLLDKLYQEEKTLSGFISKALYMHPDNEMHGSEDRMVFEEADHAYTLLSAVYRLPSLHGVTTNLSVELQNVYNTLPYSPTKTLFESVVKSVTMHMAALKKDYPTYDDAHILRGMATRVLDGVYVNINILHKDINEEQYFHDKNNTGKPLSLWSQIESTVSKYSLGNSKENIKKMQAISKEITACEGGKGGNGRTKLVKSVKIMEDFARWCGGLMNSSDGGRFLNGDVVKKIQSDLRNNIITANDFVKVCCEQKDVFISLVYGKDKKNSVLSEEQQYYVDLLRSMGTAKNVFYVLAYVYKNDQASLTSITRYLVTTIMKSKVYEEWSRQTGKSSGYRATFLNNAINSAFGQVKHVGTGKFFATLVDECKKHYDVDEIDNHLVQALSELQFKGGMINVAHFVLRTVDHSKCSTHVDVWKMKDKMSLQVEHIWPRNPNDDSIAEFGASKDVVRSDLKKHWGWCNTLGNMMLLGATENREASNLPFSKKREIYKRNAGHPTSQDVFEKTTFLINDVNQRGADLAKQFVSLM